MKTGPWSHEIQLLRNSIFAIPPLQNILNPRHPDSDSTITRKSNLEISMKNHVCWSEGKQIAVKMDPLNQQLRPVQGTETNPVSIVFCLIVLCRFEFLLASNLSQPAPQAPGNGRAALRTAFGGGRRFAPPAAAAS